MTETQKLISAYRLSEQQVDVLTLLMEGYDNQEIASELGSTVGAVKSVCHAVYNKLGVSTRGRCMAKLWAEGWGFKAPVVTTFHSLPRGQA